MEVEKQLPEVNEIKTIWDCITSGRSIGQYLEILQEFGVNAPRGH